MNVKQTTHFGLIRHAPTIWNEEKRIQGLLNSPLSPKGQKMAKSWGITLKKYPWNRILASNLERVKETIALVNSQLHLPLHFDRQLREQDWGTWSAKTVAELKTTHKAHLHKLEKAGWNFKTPNGEDRKQVLKRSLAALQDAHRRWPGEMILVACHEGVIKCLLYHLEKRKFLPTEPKLIKPYHLHFIIMTDQGLRTKQINACALQPSHK